MLPALTPCKLHVHDTTPFFETATAKLTRSQRQHLSGWENDPFSTELSLQRAAARLTQDAAWAADSAATADLIFIASNFSLLCATQKQYTARQLRSDLLSLPGLWSGSTLERPLPPKAVSLQYSSHCQGFVSGPKAWPANDTLMLLDQLNTNCRGRRIGCQDAVAPFAITGPQWLTKGRLTNPLPWEDRKLIFFGGHIPKPYLVPLRYELWSQLRRDPRATTESKTLNCSVGAYAICAHPDLKAPLRTPPNLSSDVYHKFCYEPCTSLSNAKGVEYAHSATQGAKASIANYYDAQKRLRSHQASCVGSFRDTEQNIADSLRQRCRSYDGERVLAEAADIERDVLRSGGRKQFLSTAAGHRFCLIAQGDPGNTAKVTETIALGAAGGCIPLYVLFNVATDREPRPPDFLRDYPHVRWLDYCDVAYFITRSLALRNMSRVLAWLEERPLDEIESKRRALLAVRPAFVMTRNASLSHPSAAEYVLSETCRKARLVSAARRGERLPEEPLTAGGAHLRCTLWGK